MENLLDYWEQPDSDYPDTPSGRIVKRIMETACGPELDGILDAFQIRGEWLQEHPDDWSIIHVGNTLTRLLENRGGDPCKLADLMRERQRKLASKLG